MIIVFIVNQYMVFIIKINNIHKTLLGTADMHRDFLHSEAAAVFVWLVWFLDLFIYLCLCLY